MIIVALICIALGVFFMKHEPGSGVGLICLIVAVVLACASCGDDAPIQNDRDVNAINSCIANGGHPITTSDQYGTVYYVACDTNGNVTP